VRSALRVGHEPNGWGDNIVHEYLKAIERRGRTAVLCGNKDRGREWDAMAQQALSARARHENRQHEIAVTIAVT
jgi:hypothetical protein